MSQIKFVQGHLLLLCGSDVPVLGLLREIDHVRGEKGLAVKLEVSLVSVHHAVHPGQELLGAVVGVQNDGNSI